MKKEGLEDRAASGNKIIKLENKDTLGNQIVKWATNCVWSGLLAGPIFSPIVYGRVSGSELAYTPPHETTVIVVFSSFVVSGLIFGSIYYFLKGRNSRGEEESYF